MKIFWLMFGFIVTILYGITEGKNSSFYDQMTCANCSRVNEECNITTKGWSCDYGFDATKLIDNGNSSNIPESLSKCMLPNMEFVVEEPLYGYCCVWSPEIGCQKVKRRDDLEDHCYKCTRAIWSSFMVNTSCPCGNFLVDVFSRGITPKPWNIIYIRLAMFIIILSLQTLENIY